MFELDINNQVINLPTFVKTEFYYYRVLGLLRYHPQSVKDSWPFRDWNKNIVMTVIKTSRGRKLDYCEILVNVDDFCHKFQPLSQEEENNLMMEYL